MLRVLARRFFARPHFDWSDHFLDLSLRDHARPQNCGAGPASEMTVLSIPTAARSTIQHEIDRIAQPVATCCAVVGESCVKRLALGAASGIRAAAITRAPADEPASAAQHWADPR